MCWGGGGSVLVGFKYFYEYKQLYLLVHFPCIHVNRMEEMVALKRAVFDTMLKDRIWVALNGHFMGGTKIFYDCIFWGEAQYIKYFWGLE